MSISKESPYKLLIEAGTNLQLNRLVIKSYKSGFDNIDFKYALTKLKSKMIELEYSMTTDKEKYFEIAKLSADIANYSHMLIYKCCKIIGENSDA